MSATDTHPTVDIDRVQRVYEPAPAEGCIMDKASSDLERACSQMAKKTALRNKDRARVKTLLVERSEIDARLSLDVDHGVARLELARRLKAIATQLRGIEHRYKLEPL